MTRQGVVHCRVVLLLIVLCGIGACRDGERTTPTTAVAADDVADGPAADAASAPRVAVGHAGASSSTDVPPVYHAIRDVIASCDNSGRCTIVGVRDDSPGLVLTLQRDPGPDGRQHLELSARGDRFAPNFLRLDGKPVDLATLPWLHAREDPSALALDDGEAIARFIDTVRNGQRLSLGDARDAPSLSLSGFAAALLLVDEHQQRIDTVDAWLRRGQRASDEVPKAAMLPTLPVPPPVPTKLGADEAKRLAAGVRASQAPLLKAEDCAEDTGTHAVSPADEAGALDAKQALVFLTCQGGAYQWSSLVFRIARDGSGAATRVVPPAPTLEGVDWQPSFGLLTIPRYDPATAMLSHHAKGRGPGDCGDSASWRFDGQTFVLAGFALMDRCGGVAPADWPVLWRTVDAMPSTRTPR